MSCSGRAWRAGLLCAIAIWTGSCARHGNASPERIAIVAFENLSANPDLTWAGRAIAAVAAAQTGGDERRQTFPASGIREAQSRLATRIVDGYLTGDSGGLAVKATVRDELSGKTSAVSTVSSRDIFAIASEIARQTGAPVAPYTTSNAAALEAYVRALGEADPAARETRLREAIRLDPQYGAPYLMLRDVLVRTNRGEEARSLLAAASGLRMTAAEKARLAAVSATSPEQEVEALMAVAKSEPGDIDAWRQASEIAMNFRLYDKALTALEGLLKLSPKDELALNMRGYSHLYRGDFASARSAFEDYRKRLPESANAIDSTAEMMFYFRKYADAAVLFLEAHRKTPEIVNGAEPFRAAYSYYLAGNLAEADRVFATWVTDPRDVRYAIWRRWTGRAAGDAPPSVQALWALQDGDRRRAAGLAALARQQGKSPAEANLASVALLLAQPSASPDEWRARLLRAIPAPQQERVRAELLGWALLLDAHAREAADHWRTTFQRASGQFNNEPRILLAASLISAGQPGEARKVMPHGFLPPAGLPANLDLLLYPIAADTAKKLHAGSAI